MYRLLLLGFASLLGAVQLAPVATAEESALVPITLRQRAKQPDGTYRVKLEATQWDARQTAMVICDMWDGHYCRASESRVAEMAPHMNEVIAAARKRGVLIIHSPSGCMDKYEGTPQRKLAKDAPPVETKIPLDKWCYIDKGHEGELPIDDSVPCEDSVPRPAVRMFTRQHEAIKIEEGDAVTESVEAFYLLRQRGIKNLIVMGVHTNMCVLGRPFGIRQMVRQGVNVVLMRDMTDSMYNPALKPTVSHFRGTELVIEHIEKHWCPTITSTDFTGRSAFRFAGDTRPRVEMVIGGKEYAADESMPNFAHLLRDEHGCYVEEHLGRGEGANYSIPGLDSLAKADVAMLFLRRRALPPEQLQQVKEFLAAGKSLIAIRTASHGFDQGDKAPAGFAQWPEFDKEVLGCDYHGHTAQEQGTEVSQVSAAKSHPILAGIDPTWHANGGLYNSLPLDASATVLLTGVIKQPDGTLSSAEPVAWTRDYKSPSGKTSRIFYTSLGPKEDFAQANFQKLLVNAVKWGAGR
jgi:nicotinamidase-related amidase